MSVWTEMMAIIGFMFKTVIESGINTSKALVFGVLLLFKTAVEATGVGSGIATIVAVLVTVGMLIFVIRFMWRTASSIALLVIGIILIALLLAFA